jgi:endoglycosylceramidase
MGDMSNCGGCGHVCLAGGKCLDGDCFPVRGKLGVSGRSMTDENGYSVFLHGINVNNRSKYNEPLHMPGITAEDWARLPKMGVNAVRFLVFHMAAEPEKDVYSAGYISAAAAEMKKATAQGLYVVIDSHQDIYGEGFHENGLAAWTCDKKYYDAYTPVQPWWMNYTNPNVLACLAQFWRSAELQKHYCGALRRIWEALKDEEFVIGVDIINEPMAGSDMGAEEFEKGLLSGLYVTCLSDLKASGFDGIAFLEPYLQSPIFRDIALDMKLLKQTHDKIVLAPHYYLSSVHEGGEYKGDKKPIEDQFAFFAEYAGRNRVPLWLGEYGGPYTAAGMERYLDDLHGILEANGFSRAYYAYDFDGSSFSPFNPDRTPRRPVTNALIRPYVERFRGDLSWTHTGDSFVFTAGEGGRAVVVVPDGFAFPETAGLDDVTGTGKIRRLLVKPAPGEPLKVEFVRTGSGGGW